ncbi:lipopolysaccharide biosynthesis protein [Sagittula salina]|uniref:Lipopolysaccharide biosynthesis protein n=1 Tax=Sagittula salina TaxID=2820268 RepID=A0A940MV09_9RHOB|nr:lipopolysaccharide biosynthesis protein [Sagittula salina]MBP0484467.1 lipopolysaccharide biosynthesis protein [Sagittula salina]
MIMRAGLWVFAGKLGAQVTRLVLVIILARLLSPEAFGVVAAVQVIVALSEVVVRFGVGAALIQSERLTRRIEGTAMTLMLLLAGMICLVIFAARGLLADWMNIPELVEVLPVTLLSFVIAAATNPATNLIAREMDYRFLAGIEVATYALGYGLVAAVLAWQGYSYWSMIIGTLVQNLLRAILIFRRRPVRPVLVIDRTEAAGLIRFGGGVFLTQMMSTLARRGDNAIVSSMFGAAALGYYSRAYALMDMTNALLGSVFREVLFSGFSKKRRESGTEGIGEAFLMAHAFAALVILPISAAMYLLADEVVLILLGRKWQEVVPLLEVLSLGMYFRLAYKVSGAFNMASGRVYGNAARNLAYVVEVVAFGYLGGSIAGVEGVAWGVLTALGCHFVTMTHYALGPCGLRWPALLRALAPFVLAAGAGTLAAMGALSLLRGSLPETATAVLASLAGLLPYLAVLFLLRRQPVLARVLRRFVNLVTKLRGGRNGGGKKKGNLAPGGRNSKMERPFPSDPESPPSDTTSRKDEP